MGLQWTCEKSRILLIFNEMIVYLCEKSFGFKRYHLKKKKSCYSVISHENCMFCPIFVEIIAYVSKDIAHLKDI